MIGSVKRIVRNLGYPFTKLTQIKHIANSLKKNPIFSESLLSRGRCKITVKISPEFSDRMVISASGFVADRHCFQTPYPQYLINPSSYFRPGISVGNAHPGIHIFIIRRP